MKKSVTVLQHTSADYLGHIEDHLEGRGIGFRYIRPFTESGRVPAFSEIGDALILLGGGPWGAAGGRDVPSLAEEVKLTRACFMAGLPIVGFGLGAQIICLATNGGVEAAPLIFHCAQAKRVGAGALNGFLPEKFPNPIYMRDRPVPPEFAEILAVDEEDNPAVFQIGKNIIGFTGHPGFKRGMAEDLIMEFTENPPDASQALDTLGKLTNDIEDALVPIMTGIIQMTGLMRPRADNDKPSDPTFTGIA